MMSEKRFPSGRVDNRDHIPALVQERSKVRDRPSLEDIYDGIVNLQIIALQSFILQEEFLKMSQTQADLAAQEETDIAALVQAVPAIQSGLNNLNTALQNAVAAEGTTVDPAIIKAAADLHAALADIEGITVPTPPPAAPTSSPAAPVGAPAAPVADPGTPAAPGSPAAPTGTQPADPTSSPAPVGAPPVNPLSPDGPNPPVATPPAPGTPSPATPDAPVTDPAAPAAPVVPPIPGPGGTAPTTPAQAFSVDPATSKPLYTVASGESVNAAWPAASVQEPDGTVLVTFVNDTANGAPTGTWPIYSGPVVPVPAAPATPAGTTGARSIHHTHAGFGHMHEGF